MSSELTCRASDQGDRTGAGTSVYPIVRRSFRSVQRWLVPELLDVAPAALLLETLFLLAGGDGCRDARRAPLVPLLELAAEPGERDEPVAVLAALVPGRNPNARRKVHESHARIGGVLVLPTLPAGAERFDAALGEEFFVPVRNLEDGVGIFQHVRCIY